MKIKSKEAQDALVNLSKVYNLQVEELLHSLQAIDPNISEVSISIRPAYSYYFIHYVQGSYPWLVNDVVHYDNTLDMLYSILYRTILFRKFK